MSDINWGATRIVSAPSLAAALRGIGRIPQPIMPGYALQARELVPMYRIDGASAATEAAGVAYLASDVAERLRRLAAAYGEWPQFEPEPYFDLLPVQSSQLVSIVERVSTVHVSFYLDALLPSFQAAVHSLADFWAADDPLEAAASGNWHAAMRAHWQRLVTILETARGRLASDVGYLAVNGAGEERNRWRRVWLQPASLPAEAGLTPALQDVPTLTLSIEFPLPASRQPGRMQRLRRARARVRRNSASRKSKVS